MSRIPASEHKKFIQAAIETAEKDGYLFKFERDDQGRPHATVIQVRPETEEDRLRQRIAELEAQLGKAIPLDTHVETEPEPELNITPAKALLSSESFVSLNDQGRTRLRYDADFGVYRVYVEGQYAGAILSEELSKLPQGMQFQSEDFSFGKGYFKQAAQFAAKPRRKPVRQVPVIQVPNLYVERDPNAAGGPAYSLD